VIPEQINIIPLHNQEACNSKPYLDAQLKLSIVIVARNDDHGGNFLNRMQKGLDNLFRLSAPSALDAEIIIVEWNNPVGATGLQNVLDWSQATLPVRIIHVPKDVHDAIPESGNSPVFVCWGQNVGIRRAKGSFVLIATADILYSQDMVSFLANGNLDENFFYGAIRHDIGDNGKVVQVRDGEPYLGFHMNACGDFTMMARGRWEQLRGYPEVPFNTYVDGTVLYLAGQTGMKQIVLTQPIYHMNHDGAETGSRPVLDISRFPLPMNQHEDWGFRDIKFEETSIK
jgi:hypothetical protein